MDSFEVSLKTVCCTCLSLDRKLTQLCKIPDGVNNLFFLLSFDSDAYKAILNKPATYLYICWECEAQMRNMCKFREKARKAQAILCDVEDGTVDIKSKSLSKLTQSHQISYNCIYKCEEDLPDNFIDCGSVINNEEILDISIKTEDLKVIETPVEKKPYLEIKPLKLKSQDSKYYSTIELSEVEMYDNIEMRKKEKSFVAAEFKCDSCILIFKDDKELDKHSVDVHLQKPRHMQCKVCKMYVSYWRLALHVSSHRKLYKCSICDQSLCGVEMLGHLRGHSVPLSDLYDLKKIALVLNPSLLRTEKRIVDRTSGYTCSECNKSFEKQSLRYKHVLECHREGFKCDTCGKSFTFKNTLRKHMSIHSPLPRQECPICKKMISTNHFKVHLRIHTDRQKKYCSVCDKYFISSDTYEKHLKNSKIHAVHDLLKYKCTLCPKGFRSMTALNDHINYNHMGKTQHKCHICNKALATRRSVTRHIMRAHQGVKDKKTREKIPCKICGKAFRDKKCVTEHEWIHTGEKPLSCAECGRGFRQTACLYVHRRNVHHVQAKRPAIVYHHVE